jgi:pimeloyl-ACP methyl ester carboxylesterase
VCVILEDGGYKMIGEINTDTFSMKYASFGEGERNLVIIPGLSLRPVTPFAFAIESAYDIFKKDYTVYLLDRRDNAPDDYESADMARDTYYALNKLGVDKAYFMGASQGGAMALVLALMHPEMVEGLVIASSSGYVNEMSKNVLNDWLDKTAKRDAVALSTSMVDVVYSKNTLAKSRDSFIKSFADLTEEEFIQFRNLCQHFDSYDVRDRLSEIKCPTLIIGCEGDMVFGADASREMYHGISSDNENVEIYIYDDTYGHAVYDEAPDFKKKAYDFLGKY